MQPTGNRVRVFLVLCCVLSCGMGVSLAGPARAEEPAEAFLRALREREYYDTALEYLEKAAQSPLVSVEFRRIVDYERGVTLVASASRQRDLQSRAQTLDQAQASLEKFIQQNPNHRLASSARRQFGNLFIERGRIKIEEAKRGAGEQNRAEAAQFFDEAYQVFAASKEELRGKLESMTGVFNPDTERQKIELRDELRKEYLEAQILSAAVLEEKADSFPEQSPQQQEVLQRAADEYKEIYEKYRTRIAGLYARMYQGRCAQKLGKLDDALSYYVSDLLAQPSTPDAFRTLKTQALLLAMECWLDPSQAKHVEAITRASQWLQKIRPAEARDPDWLKLRLQLARAHQAYAQSLESKKPGDRQIENSYDEARKEARAVARFPGDHQEAARELLASLPGAVTVADAGDKDDPKTFDEAKKAGREAITEMQNAEFVLNELPARLEKESDAEIKQQIQLQIDDARQSIGTKRAEAKRLFELALDLSDPQTDLEELNLVRYFLCFLYWLEEEYYDTAVLGEFLARRYPDHPSARQGAKLALAAYLRLYNQADESERSFETRRVVDIARYTSEAWSGSPEAIEAVNTLIPITIQSGDLEQAQQYLTSIPESSPHRAAAELKMGRAIWGEYLSREKEVSDANPDAPLSAELLAVRKSAIDLLQQGANRVKDPAEIDLNGALALISLAKAYLESEQAQQAQKLLEDSTTGLLTLLQAQHPALSNPALAQDVYTTALRTYIGLLPTAQDKPSSEAMIAKAKGAMADLQALGEAGGSTLAVYYTVARDLERQIKLVREPARKKILADGFETFLNQVKGEADDFQIINWVAESYASLAAGYDSESNDAKRYLGMAAASYQEMLDRAQRDPQWMDPRLVTEVARRKASVLRDQGEFEEAISLFKDVLTQSPMRVDIQVEAAKTYQAWAGERNQAAKYDNANKGAFVNAKTRSNVIWGWIRIAKLTAGNDDFKDTFYEARYNLAVCHFSYAKRMAKKDSQNKYLNYAKQDILRTQLAYPDMGGAKWRPKFDALLREIQRSMKERPTGLQELNRPAKRAS